MNKQSLIESRIVSKDISIINALKKMDELSVKLLIIMEYQKFVSLISIGDIQRAIINNIPIEKPISFIIRKVINTASVKDNIEQIKEKMLEERDELMPIIDNENNLIDVIFWEELFTEQKKEKCNYNFPVVIMAGGKGTRMHPITNIIPKPLVPIGEKTIIEKIMDDFISIGIKEFYVSINYKAEMIKNYFANGYRCVEINFIEETNFYGTAGSLSLLKDKIKSTFFVSNCDILVDQDLSKVIDYHESNGNKITIIAALLQNSIAYGTLETGNDGLLISLKEKPEFTHKINSGVYILEPEVLQMIPNDRLFHMTDLIEKVNEENGKVGVFPISEKSWQDIGEWKHYVNYLKNNK